MNLSCDIDGIKYTFALACAEKIKAWVEFPSPGCLPRKFATVRHTCVGNDDDEALTVGQELYEPEVIHESIGVWYQVRRELRIGRAVLNPALQLLYLMLGRWGHRKRRL